MVWLDFVDYIVDEEWEVRIDIVFNVDDCDEGVNFICVGIWVDFEVFLEFGKGWYDRGSVLVLD